MNGKETHTHTHPSRIEEHIIHQFVETMPKHNIPSSTIFFPIGSVTKSSTAKCWHENLVEKIKIFVQDFVTIKILPVGNPVKYHVVALYL